MAPLGYAELAWRVIRPWFPTLPDAELRLAIERATGLFDDAAVVPLATVGSVSLLELFHGPTLAFKDLALTLFGDLLAMARRAAAMEAELLVIVATSGDTGSAAIAGLEGRPGIRVVVFYPAEGTSRVQRLQMTTRSADNVLVLGLTGNFDDAQRIAKFLLSDTESRTRFARRGFSPCSANSINVGRLVPQIAYYVHACRSLVAAGRLQAGGSFDVIVPSGNFGNVVAARYAKSMGLPIGNFIVATNRNRVLADFLETGTYDRNRPFHITTSPSMDILVSSNLERLLFEATGRDSSRTAALMGNLSGQGRYSLRAEEKAAFADFQGGSADEAEAAEEIRRVFEESGYLLDPHTATAAAVLRRIGSKNPAVVTATASPFKFPATVAEALGGLPISGETDDFALIRELAHRTGLPFPTQLEGLGERPERHRQVLEPREAPAAIDAWLGS
jgi:threonine synthase